jgi:hypothetical protein
MQLSKKIWIISRVSDSKEETLRNKQVNKETKTYVWKNSYQQPKVQKENKIK